MDESKLACVESPYDKSASIFGIESLVALFWISVYFTSVTMIKTQPESVT